MLRSHADTIWQWLQYTYLTPSERARLHTLGDCTHVTSSSDVPSWSSWSLTEILYRRGDFMSRAFALASFLPLVVVIFLSGLASAPSPQRRQPALILLLFLVFNVALNVLLKSVLASPRPVHPAALSAASTSPADCYRISYSTKHGMPSDHAQFMTFFVLYLVLKGQIRSRGHAAATHKKTPRTPTPSKQKQRSRLASTEAPRITKTVAALFLFIDLFVCVGRVYNGYHTLVQVLVGAALGAVLAMVCVQPALQGLMRCFTEHIIAPIMLVCTSWTELLY